MKIDVVAAMLTKVPVRAESLVENISIIKTKERSKQVQQKVLKIERMQNSCDSASRRWSRNPGRVRETTMRPGVMLPPPCLTFCSFLNRNDKKAFSKCSVNGSASCYPTGFIMLFKM